MLAKAQCILFLLSGYLAADSDIGDVRSLYETHDWFKLRDTVEAKQPPPFYKVVVACAFRELAPCEREVARFIKSASALEQKCQARVLLLNSSIRAGRFHLAYEEWQRMLAANCAATDSGNFIRMVATFSRLPELSVERRRISVLPYQLVDGNLFIPISVNDQRVNYMVDTGANISILSESEAERLRMTVFEVRDVHFGDATGNGVAVQKVGIADRLIAGNIELKHVPFVVIGDDGPIRQLAPGKRGVLGMQPLLAFQTIRWDDLSGTIHLAFHQKKKNIRNSNLCFDGLNVAAAVGFGSTTLYTHLDTGAVDTQLNPRFAREFPDLIEADKGSTKITGTGGTIEADTLKVPALSFRIGGFRTSLPPAQVLLSEIGQPWFHALLGLDLLGQARQVTLDFNSMQLTLSH